MKTIPSPVTEDADLRFHAKEGVVIPINFQDATGAPRDMTGRTLKLYIKGGPTTTLTEGNTSDQLVLKIVKGTCDTLVGKLTQFAVVDETDPTPVVEWSGTLMVNGFTA